LEWTKNIDRCFLSQGRQFAARFFCIVRAKRFALTPDHHREASPSMETIRLVVGLGNPGRAYVATRHNAGFWWADALAAKERVLFSDEAKFHAEVARVGELRLIKPTTFMNRSGQAVAAVARFFDIPPHQILIAHDELDLLPGAVRLKQGGGYAGHNGLKDIAAQLGSPDFWRLRFGIGHPRQSETPQQPVADYVLKPPNDADRTALETAVDRAVAAWTFIESGRTAEAMTFLHTR
jgi:PTH1 family peptidyl-tRNA hydrolase